MDELTQIISQEASSGGSFTLTSTPDTSIERVVAVFLSWLDSQVGGVPYNDSALADVSIRIDGGLSVLVQPTKIHVRL